MKVPIKSIGILGGGQLARMLAESAPFLKLKPMIFVKSSAECAVQIAPFVVSDLQEFLSKVDLVTIENEFVELEVLKKIENSKIVFPSSKTLGLIQNKLHQKINFKKNKIPISDFYKVFSLDSLKLAAKKLGNRLVLKAQTMGYDGKGIFILDFKKTTPEKFLKDHPNFNGYAEKFIKFEKELAVIVARSSSGEMVTFPVVETFQNNGICNYVIKPKLSKTIESKAQNLAKKIIKKFDGVGVFGVEMFLEARGKILINEVAPRVHNSGHITMSACNVSQFEQHLRAITGLPLIKAKWKYKNAVMLNILGKGIAIPDKINLKLLSGESIHWYGKTGFGKNRKLGHIIVVSDNTKTEGLLKRAIKIREMIKA